MEEFDDIDELEERGCEFPCQVSIHCSACGNELECSRSDTLTYLRAGWPKCCGETMTVVLGSPAA